LKSPSLATLKEAPKRYGFLALLKVAVHLCI